MTNPKPFNSSFRYLIARIKPLANVKVWGSVGIMGVVGLLLWQYSIHPEWLGNDPGTASIEGEFEGEVGNNVDIGVTIQDLEKNRLNSPGVPVAPGQLQDNPLNQPTWGNDPNPFPSGSVGKKPELKQQKSPSIKFEPLMPNLKNLGSLFPPVQPSKNTNKPIKIPDTLGNRKPIPQNTALENALEEVFSEDLPEAKPSNLSPKNNQPTNPNPNSSPRPNYQTAPSSGRNTPETQPFNNPYTYTPPQPYSQPYGNGTAPAPVRGYPPSAQSPNSYPTVNSNPNYPNGTNQNQTTPNYGIQPPQVDQYGSFGN